MLINLSDNMRNQIPEIPGGWLQRKSALNQSKDILFFVEGQYYVHVPIYIG